MPFDFLKEKGPGEGALWYVAAMRLLIICAVAASAYFEPMLLLVLFGVGRHDGTRDHRHTSGLRHQRNSERLGL